MSVSCVCICMLHMRAETLARESLRSPEAGVTALWVLGIQSRLSARADSVLNHWMISPAPLQPISLL